MLSELVNYLAYGLSIRLSRILSIDQYVIQIYNNENILLFSQNLVDVSLEGDWSIKKAIRHDLILKIPILGPKRCLPLIAFINPYSMIGDGEV